MVVVVVDVADVCVCVCVCVYGRGEVMKRVSVCVCVHACWGGGDGGLQRQEDGRYNDHVPLHHAHQHPAPYTLVYTCILIMETNTPPPPPLQTPSLVVSSHFNLKGSSTSPSR